MSSNIELQTCTDILPAFQLIKGIDLGYTDHYVFDVTVNSQYAMTTASDNFIRLYDLSTLSLAHSISAHQDKISQMKLKGDNYLFTCSEDHALKRWDLRTPTVGPVQTFQCNLLAYL
jgi:WD40 repeat protein